MRFIPLGKESPKVADCYVWSVKKFGCGGNFVLNRKDKFERMIKDQGKTFWFRFWLNFYLNTIFPLFKKIHFANKKGIECDICSMAIDLHKQFLEVSEKERIQFSISVVKRILTPPPMNTDLYEMCTQYYTMAFATALCDVFHKWLQAQKVQQNIQTYWKLPNQFRDPNFVPGRVEKYIVFVWKEEVAELLGLTMQELPHLLQLGLDVYANPVVKKIHEAFEHAVGSEMQLNSPKLAQYKLRVQQKIVEVSRLIQKSDERPNPNRKLQIKRKQNQPDTVRIFYSPKNIVATAKDEAILKKTKIEAIQEPKPLETTRKTKLLESSRKPKLVGSLLKPKLIGSVQKPKLTEKTETKRQLVKVMQKPNTIKTRKQNSVEMINITREIVESDLTYRLEKLKTWLENRSPDNRSFLSCKIRPNATQSAPTRIPSIFKELNSNTDQEELRRCISNEEHVATPKAIEFNTPKKPDFSELRKTKLLPQISIKVGSVLQYFNQHPTLDSLLIIFATILLFYGRVVLNTVT